MRQAFNFLWQTHGRWLVVCLVVVNSLVMLNLALGDLKSRILIDWLDVWGEGGAALVALAWFFLILTSRPAGTTTNLLGGGIFCVVLSLLQDALDEVIALPDSALWENGIEAGAMPLGMVALTWGLYLLRREQVAIMGQLRKRERLFRRHPCIDSVTQIGGLRYLKDQLVLEAKRADHSSRPFALLLVDLDGFARINREYGQWEGDRILYLVSELLILNLRDSDLICRYAGDRYAVLLPATTRQQAEIIAAELEAAIAHFACRTARGEGVQLSASVGLAPCRDSFASDEMLERARRSLMKAKERSAVAGAGMAS